MSVTLQIICYFRNLENRIDFNIQLTFVGRLGISHFARLMYIKLLHDNSIRKDFHTTAGIICQRTSYVTCFKFKSCSRATWHRCDKPKWIITISSKVPIIKMNRRQLKFNVVISKVDLTWNLKNKKINRVIWIFLADLFLVVSLCLCTVWNIMFVYFHFFCCGRI